MKRISLLSALCGCAFFAAALERSEGTETNRPASVAVVNGDLNGDWYVDLSDAVYLLSHLFGGSPAPVPIDCGTDVPLRQNGDANGDGTRDVSDAVFLLA